MKTGVQIKLFLEGPKDLRTEVRNAIEFRLGELGLVVRTDTYSDLVDAREYTLILHEQFEVAE